MTTSRLWETRFRSCLWWAMHAKVMLLWKKDEIIHQKFNILRHNFKSVTQKHAGRYEIWRKAAAGGSTRLVCKHLSVRLLPKVSFESTTVSSTRARSNACAAWRRRLKGKSTVYRFVTHLRWFDSDGGWTESESIPVKEVNQGKDERKITARRRWECQVNQSGTDFCICRHKLFMFSPESPLDLWKSPRSKRSQCRQVNANSANLIWRVLILSSWCELPGQLGACRNREPAGAACRLNQSRSLSLQEDWNPSQDLPAAPHRAVEFLASADSEKCLKKGNKCNSKLQETKRKCIWKTNNRG